jgi:hypothetical protein
MVSVLLKPEADEPWRLLLQALQRLGSFLKFLSWKKCCSPAVKTKSAPQSTHFKMRSWNSTIVTVPRYSRANFPLPWREPAIGRRPATVWHYSISRRLFFRLRLRANACLALSFSPGFK